MRCIDVLLSSIYKNNSIASASPESKSNTLRSKFWFYRFGKKSGIDFAVNVSIDGKLITSYYYPVSAK